MGDKAPRYIVVLGSLMSGLGKGIVTASAGRILQSKGYSASPIKFDGYLNVDCGTMNPLRHGEVFVLDDGTECEVREAYTGPEGLIEHNRNIVEARTKLFADYADNHFMTVYGEPTPQLLDLVKAHHMEHQFKWFSFVKGLGPSAARRP